MKKATTLGIVLLFSLGAVACVKTLDRFAPLCELVLAEKVCTAIDVPGDIAEDLESVTGE